MTPAEEKIFQSVYLFAKQAKQLRDAQKRYFKTRELGTLILNRTLEDLFDKATDEFLIAFKAYSPDAPSEMLSPNTKYQILNTE